ncbi:hypothetical protein N752_00220 [Desulforamulus aquiferis]|nr:hypothetical protein [Desulforamulus aquiferis]RYD07039.1 hypothetical protein N752_00220 [Desulforamulus aquiferis]
MMQPSTITKLPKLVPTINKYIDTNLGLTDMVSLARAAQNLSNVEIVSQTMPGKFLDMDGISYWSIDPSQAKNVAKSMIQEGKVFDVVLGEETVNTKAPQNTTQQASAENKVDYLPGKGTETKQTDNKQTDNKQTDGKKTEPKTNQTDGKKDSKNTDGQKPANVEIMVQPVPGSAENQIGSEETKVPTNSGNQQGSDNGPAVGFQQSHISTFNNTERRW